MKTRFGQLLEMLQYAFSHGVTEQNYHDIVACLRDYDNHRDPVDVEKSELHQKKFPLTYHPCDFMENIRWGFVFLAQSNHELDKMIEKYRLISNNERPLADFHCMATES